MSGKERDPRIDPMLGDILRFGEAFEHQVMASIDDNEVRYDRITAKGEASKHRCSLESWRRWASKPGVRVIEAGQSK